MLRTGDCYYISGEYSSAIIFFDKIINTRARDADYALYQKALSLGALGNYRAKTETLGTLISTYPGSTYRDDAMYEMALTYTFLEDDANALTYFDRLIQSYPNSSHTATAILKKGFVYYNRNEHQPAIETFKLAVSRYPASKQAREALAALKNIYLDMNRMADYYSYAKGLSFAEVSSIEEDSLNFKAAENIYLQGDYQRAIGGFDNYLQQFPQGAFTDDARFYLAECLIKTDQEERAIQEYKIMADRPRTSFSEEVLVSLSDMLYQSGDYEEALPYFKKLENMAEYQQNMILGLAGSMRCQFHLNYYPQAIETGKKLLDASKVPDELIQETHLTLARSYFEEDLIELARTEYSILSGSALNEWAAESYYYLALIDWDAGRDTEAEGRIFELSEKLAAHDYWVVKGFILLADIYVKRGDNFQARQTLQSIIDNYEGPELGNIARNKLKSIDPND
jgi:TolA-binding protein